MFVIGRNASSRTKGHPTIFDLLSAEKWRMLTGWKAHESAGKSSQCRGVKLTAMDFWRGGTRVQNYQKAFAARKRGQEKGVSGRKEHATVHIRQHPMGAAVSGARKWPGDQGWKGCMQSIPAGTSSCGYRANGELQGSAGLQLKKVLS